MQEITTLGVALEPDPVEERQGNIDNLETKSRKPTQTGTFPSKINPQENHSQKEENFDTPNRTKTTFLNIKKSLPNKLSDLYKKAT